ncbi:MAG: hypothetical protein K2N90_06635, partial [Lachnospiraceae bacterium]|nr:hypothetical protein [Lachnospiraceae bacterium]
MKKAGVISVIIGILFLAVCFAYVAYTRTPVLEEPSPSASVHLSIAVENISAVQFNTARTKAKRNFQGFVDSVQNTVTAENKADSVQRADNYDVVSLIYEDGAKDIFYFFNQDNMWYLETPDGGQYKNADFITDYIERVDITESKTTFVQKPAVWQLELEKETEVFDTAFFFKELVYYNVNERGMAKEEAINDARKSMQTDRTLYQYALENGYGLTRQEMQLLLQEEIAQAKLAENYEEVSALYREQGLILEAYLENREEKLAVSKTIGNLYNAKYEEFRHGKDTIKGQICENVTEYWNAFLLEEVQPQMAEYDFSEFQKELDAAEDAILAEIS